MSIARDLDLLFEVGSLRFVKRVWEQFHEPGSANVAEHILRVAWTAQIIGKYEGADLAKVSQMALMHDLYITRTGDVHWLNSQYTSRDKDAAIADTAAESSIAADILAMWAELQAAETIEAKVVRDADMLDIDLEFCELRQKWAFASREAEVRHYVYEHKLVLPTSKKIWQALQDADPHAWYIDEYHRGIAAKIQK